MILAKTRLLFVKIPSKYVLKISYLSARERNTHTLLCRANAQLFIVRVIICQAFNLLPFKFSFKGKGVLQKGDKRIPLMLIT